MKKLRFVVVGAGMSGILALVKLKERGHDVVALEKASNIGGTWRENRYPGLCCDTPSHTYTFSFAPNPDFTRNYVSGKELQDYFERIVREYDLESNIRYGREVTSIVFDDGEWTVSTSTGEAFTADSVVIATGVLHHPRMPDIAGLESFAGPAIHTARWPDDLGLSDKRVGVIGNGSTGVQLVSALAGTVPQLFHFQRSPQWIMPQAWEEYSEDTREAFRRDPSLIHAIRTDPEFLARVEGFNSAITDADSIGMKMRVTMTNGEAPSMIAASSMPLGRSRMKAVSTQTVKGSVKIR